MVMKLNMMSIFLPKQIKTHNTLHLESHNITVEFITFFKDI